MVATRSPQADTPAAIVSLMGAPAGTVDPVVEQARRFADQLLAGRSPPEGTIPPLALAEGMAAVLREVGAAPALQAAAWLLPAADELSDPPTVLGAAFGADLASLVVATRRLEAIRATAVEGGGPRLDRVRRMLLAFSSDLRVVLLFLSAPLAGLRWHAQMRVPVPAALAWQARHVAAPLANRLGIGQLKWELEDLAFRFLEPQEYRSLATSLAERRIAREAGVAAARLGLQTLLARHGIRADVHGRPKHLYSIWKKMRGKGLPLEQVFDMRALRVVVDDVAACYAALAVVHAQHEALPAEFDDYIAKPKANGYQSLHTVVLGEDGRPMEIQIRTAAMHAHAEHGVAAHWAYKEAGSRGYGGRAQAATGEARAMEARKAVLRQLLAWEREQAEGEGDARPLAPTDERVYVLTPQADVVELSAGATPIDFAYALHTSVGHRCRGARVDGQIVPLNTPLQHGQTVEVVTVRDGAPSMDWLNPELGYLKSPRARAKVRAWFNEQQQASTIARGREAIEKLLQREGRTAINLGELAQRLGMRSAEHLFETAGKDELSLRGVAELLRAPSGAAGEPAGPPDAMALKRPKAGETGQGGVLVVGMDSLLTSLARCCRPVPPDPIGGYVTRGRGVAIHRVGCPNLRELAARDADRVIDVAWGAAAPGRDAVYPMGLVIEAVERHGLLRDVSELFAREKVRVTAMSSLPLSGRSAPTVQMRLTVEVADASRLDALLRQIGALQGILHARRA